MSEMELYNSSNKVVNGKFLIEGKHLLTGQLNHSLQILIILASIIRYHADQSDYFS